MYVLLIYFNRNKNLIYVFEITKDINLLITEASKKQKKRNSHERDHSKRLRAIRKNNGEYCKKARDEIQTIDSNK